MPDQPTYKDVAKFAKVLNNKAAGFYGVAASVVNLVGVKTWRLVDTIANTFGATWFDMDLASHTLTLRNGRPLCLQYT